MILDIPKSWRSVLSEIQKHCPSAVIAGGALRDLYHEVQVKDLDIFIEAGDSEEAEGLMDIISGRTPSSDQFSFEQRDQ